MIGGEWPDAKQKYVHSNKQLPFATSLLDYRNYPGQMSPINPVDETKLAEHGCPAFLVTSPRAS